MNGEHDPVMPPVHHLLRQQIDTVKSRTAEFDAAALLALVSAAYAAADDDRKEAEQSLSRVAGELDSMKANLESLVKNRTSGLETLLQHLVGAIENVDQGIVVIDVDGRVIVFNSRFAQLTGLQPTDLAGTPLFRDVVGKMVELGEFDPMGEEFKHWAMAKGRLPGPQSFQRTRPDGTVLSARVCPLPDGGELRTLSDITHHIRHSAEIDSIKQTLELTLENVVQGIVMLDADQRVSIFNRRAVELLGFPEGLLVRGATLKSLTNFQMENGEFDHLDADIRASILTFTVPKEELIYERERSNGTILEIRILPLADGSAILTYTDVTRIRTREKALERSREEYRSLFSHSVVGIYRTSVDGHQLRANPALVRMNGYESEEEMLADMTDIAGQWYVDPKRRDEFMAAMEKDGMTSDFVSEVYSYKTGEKYWVSESAWLVHDEHGTPAYYEGMVIDATERKNAESEIAHIALHDMLTKLPNRTLFYDTLKAALGGNRHGHDIAVLCLDLDNFKDVNDTMGHDSGDILLRLASRRLARAIPPGGMAARFGGDEFAVLLPEIRDRETVLSLARLIVESLSRPFRIRGTRVYVGVSIGIALAPTDANEAQDVLKKADIALYRAKADGRGTYAFFDNAMTAALLARREIEVDLRRAIAQNEFCLFYQPIIDLETTRPNGYEALIRWNHPQKGLLSPLAFIEVAEQCGLIVQIGEVVLRQACQFIRRHHSSASVSVNLSPVQFRNHQLAVSVVNALAESGLPPSRLILEITESVLLTDDPRTLDILKQLRALGVRIALDDFGIGHSSLSYLQKFPFDRIKIDKSFVQHADDGMMNTAIRRAILGLGNDIGIEVVVEGVETAEQRDMLLYEGCRYVQGYFYGKPKPESELPLEHPGQSAETASLTKAKLPRRARRATVSA